MHLSPSDPAHLYLAQDMTGPDLHEMAGGQAAVHTDRCPGKTTANEDAAALIPAGPGSGVFIVADGVGGLPAGQQASNLTVQILHATLRPAVHAGQKLRTAILNGIEEANQRVRALGGGAATTLAVAELAEGRVRSYHIGDSAVLLVGQRGKMKLLTVSHSPVGFALEAGLLTQTEAIHHEDRHLVSNVIGADDMRIEVGQWRRLARRDTLLLATDGVFDNLHLTRIINLVRKGPLAAVADSLAHEVRQRMERPTGDQPSKPDDATFVLYRPGGAVPSG
jgi:serine/threonine protein phosphatase PrpC